MKTRTWATIVGLIVIVGIGILIYRPRTTSAPQTISEGTPQGAQPQADTSDWKTYTNSQYGYSFKYPADLALAENGNEVDVSDNTRKEVNTFAVNVVSQPAPNLTKVYTDPYELAKDSLKSTQGLSTENKFGTTVARLDYYRSSSESDHIPAVMYYIVKGNNLIVLTSWYLDNPNAQSIIDSFGFTQHKTISTSSTDWKTYTNTKYGYSFKYPADHTVYSSIDQTGKFVPATSDADQVIIASNEQQALCCEPATLEFDAPFYHPDQYPAYPRSVATLGGEQVKVWTGDSTINSFYKVFQGTTTSEMSGNSWVVTITQSQDDPLLNSILATVSFQR